MTDTIEFLPDTADLPPDEPVIDSDHLCLECGKPVTRKGTRGRWPSYCDEHSKSAKTGKPRATTKGSAAQAVQAAKVLSKYNAMLGVGLMVLPGRWAMPQTASAIADASETFEAQATEALASDPELCKMILRSGVMSGRAALVVAYGMMLGSVVPTAVVEWREK